jgi:alpha-glucosidase
MFRLSLRFEPSLFSASAFLFGLLSLSGPGLSHAEHFNFSNGRQQLQVEFTDEQVVRMALAAASQPASSLTVSSPMIRRLPATTGVLVQRSGPNGDVLRTRRLQVSVDPVSLCVEAIDLVQHENLTQMCPELDNGGSGGLTGLQIHSPHTRHVYGLGEAMQSPGEANGTWMGKVRSPGDPYGNHMQHFGVGDAANAQFPVLYALGEGYENYALMLDLVQPQSWDFTVQPWHIDVSAPVLRWYLMAGDNLPQLRRAYMNLVGHPPVPPRTLFGMWVSEFGYRDWAQVDAHLQSLRSRHFPVDGFVLDLFWFGGITSGSEHSRMGTVDWDLTHFPDPAGHLRQLAAQGVGIIPIEESYISRSLPEYDALRQNGFLVRAGCADCDPVYLTHNPWWGKGSMIDWTAAAAGDYWHDVKREPLIQAGVAGHWIDLGEPEAYDSNDWVAGEGLDGHGAADYHNLYNFRWAESIARGYARHQHTQRPFILARSGTAGIQRFGVAMWSGDIGARQSLLATHENARMHMSLSGVDYFGSDVGGFHRAHLTGPELDDLYTRWFAVSSLLDVPLRPHTENLCQCEETAPDRIGNRQGNLANLQLRYQLIPYFYSLAHLAWRDGDPVTPPLVYAFQADQTVRNMGTEKMLGPNLLVDLGPSLGTSVGKTYLPAGRWYDFRTGRPLTSAGEWVDAPIVATGERVDLPLYVRAGAIIPLQAVDETTMGAAGAVGHSTSEREWMLRVFPDGISSRFTVFEDDGHSTAYQQGAVRTTEVNQVSAPDRIRIHLDAANGGYDGAEATRTLMLQVADGAHKTRIVRANHRVVPAIDNPTQLLQNDAGWSVTADGWLLIRLEHQAVDAALDLELGQLP